MKINGVKDRNAYLTVAKAGLAEQSIERSRFIGQVIPAKTVSDCDDFFERVRREHRRATHNVPAYVLGENCSIQWASDDGEPRGTAGAPIVHMLVNEGVSDVAIVVTRYFGGVKLGTGGLVRAYTGTAKLALEAAGLARVSEKYVLDVETDYAGYHSLETAAGDAYIMESATFAEIVTASLACEPETADTVKARIRAVCPSARIIRERTKKVITPL